LPSCEPQVIYTKYAERKVNETSDKSRVDVCSKVNNECRITNSDGNSCDLCAIYRYRRNGICRRQRLNFNDNCNPVIASIQKTLLASLRGLLQSAPRQRPQTLLLACCCKMNKGLKPWTPGLN